jgi:hypothetical protein
MKLSMEFEEEDLRDMIEGYFQKSGFLVQNLDQLLHLFSKAYPDGIQVQVETTNVSPPSEEWTPKTEPQGVVKVQESETFKDPEIQRPKDNGYTNKPMSASDLFDPTPGSVPTRDEQLAQSRKELEHIIAQSKEIEETKPEATE